MTNIEDLAPDEALAKLLDKKVSVQTSATASHVIRAYDEGSRPNKGLGNEFIEITWNGGARSLTQPLGLYRGGLMLSVYVKTQDDGRAKKKLTKQIIAQCEKLVNNVSADGFFFKLDPNNVITPTTVNLTTGYSTTVLNVEWRVTDRIINN